MQLSYQIKFHKKIIILNIVIQENTRKAKKIKSNYDL